MSREPGSSMNNESSSRKPFDIFIIALSAEISVLEEIPISPAISNSGLS